MQLYKRNAKKGNAEKIDSQMLLIILLLLLFGSLMVFSASSAFAVSKYGDRFYFIRNQIFFASCGLVLMLVATHIDDRLLKKIAPIVYLVSVLLLAAVLVIGTAAGVAKRWIYIGSFSFQPTEIAKFAIVLMLAWYFDRFQNEVMDTRNFWRSSRYSLFYPFLFLALMLILILLENHFSGTIIVFAIGMAVIFAGGARKIWFGIAGAAAGIATFVLLFFTDYARERIDIWLHPERFPLQGEVWQTIQGLNAIGSGGFFGVGFGKSLQKQLFVSAPQNDFIFSIVCEEFGFLGALAVILLFGLFIWRGFVIGLRAKTVYASLVAIGITCHVAIQALLNMMVVTAMIPNTGITLPFFSYGGSALVMLLGEMGILLNISKSKR